MGKKPEIIYFASSKECLVLEKEILKNYSNIIFTRQENEQMHNSYSQEVLEMQSIENGDLDMLEKSWSNQSSPTSFGILSQNPLRNVKNNCIVVVSLASRAAIRGGVSPENAFTLCDSYVQGIERCDDIVILSQITHRAEKYFTQLVMEAKGITDPSNEFYSRHIDRCKNYIFSHLHQKLTVQEIADALDLNPNYLNSLFKKHEKQTILQFILQEKLKLVRNMLIYSSYSYSEIANYLGFASQSHLGVHFKKTFHMTMSQFRAMYQAEGTAQQEPVRN